MALDINRGSITLPKEVSNIILQKTQDQSAIMQLARKIDLPGHGVTIPIITGDPEAQWVNETDEKPVSNPKLGTKDMQAYKLAVIETFSNEFMRDDENLAKALISRLPLALASKFDATVMGGVTKPGENFDNFTNSTAQVLEADTAWKTLVAAEADVAANGGIVNGYGISPQAKSILLSALDGNGRPLFINNVSEGAIPIILGSKTTISKGLFATGTSNVLGIVGDWTQAVYGTVEGVKIDVSDQATLTIASSPVNLWQRNMVAVRAEIELGFRADTKVFNRLTAGA